MANPAFVQGNSADTNVSATTRTAVFSSAQTAGNCNVVAIGVFGSSATINSVVDTKGNAYSVIKTQANGTLTTFWIYAATNIAVATAGSNTVTVTLGATLGSWAIATAEYSSISTSSVATAGDGSISATGTSTGPATTAALTTTNAVDLLVACGGCRSLAPTGAGTGYTQRTLTTNNDLLLEDKVVTSAGSQTATYPVSGSTDWNIVLVALKGSGAVTSKPLAGTCTAVGTNTGVLKATKVHAGTCTARGANTGVLKATKVHAGTCTAIATNTGVLKATKVHAGTCTATGGKQRRT